MRTLGGALGGQLSATFHRRELTHGLPTVTGFTATFLMATGSSSSASEQASWCRRR
jgi:hypothetical protein